MPDASPEPISSLRNLGPATEDAFARVGITNVGQLRALGADAAYQKLIENGQRPHFISYYVLVMALQGRPWNDCRGAEKAALRQRFDEIKARVAADPDLAARRRLDAALRELGVLEPAPRA